MTGEPEGCVGRRDRARCTVARLQSHRNTSSARAIEAGDLVSLAELVPDRPIPSDRPRLFKSTGMSWEDTVVSGAVLAAFTPS